MRNDILIYTSPGCPDCAALKQWLTEAGLGYHERDLSDPSVSDEAKSRCGVRVAPVTVIGEQCLYGTFANQLPQLQTLLQR